MSLLACFPHNPRARTYAKLGEGGALVGGIVLAAVAGTSADCDQMAMPGIDTSACRNKATLLGGIGVALIVGGLLGFVATISSAEEDKTSPPVQEIKAQKPAETTPPAETGSAAAPPAEGSGAGSAAAGSAATPPPAAAGSAATP